MIQIVKVENESFFGEIEQQSQSFSKRTTTNSQRVFLC